MSPLFIILLAAYFTAATSFFLFMFLRVGPKRTTAWVKALMLDKDFVEETTKLTNACLIRNMVDELVPVIRDAVVDHVVSAVGDRDFALPTDFWKNFVATLDGWYGGMQKKANAETRAAEGEARDAIQYAAINQGNPVAMDAIMARVSAKSPILGAMLQMAQQVQGSQTQARPGGNGSGRY